MGDTGEGKLGVAVVGEVGMEECAGMEMEGLLFLREEVGKGEASASRRGTICSALSQSIYSNPSERHFNTSSTLSPPLTPSSHPSPSPPTLPSRTAPQTQPIRPAHPGSQHTAMTSHPRPLLAHSLGSPPEFFPRHFSVPDFSTLPILAGTWTLHTDWLQHGGRTCFSAGSVVGELEGRDL